MLNSIVGVFGLIILISCGSARTIVERPVVVPRHMITNHVQICCDEDTVFVPENVKVTFEKELRKKLYGDNLVQDIPGIQLKYRFIQFNEGNRLMRYALGGIGNAGEASLMVEVIYLDCEGIEIGKIRAEGKISSGIFGGSSDFAIEKTAAEIANYTRGVILNQE